MFLNMVTPIKQTYKWEMLKKINIKSAYHSSEDMVNIEDFHSNLLKIDKKSHKDINIYYTLFLKNLVIMKIFSVNPLYLIINSPTGYFKEKKW